LHSIARFLKGLLLCKIREGKEQYRRKLESKLAQNNTREVGKGMRNITGQ